MRSGALFTHTRSFGKGGAAMVSTGRAHERSARDASIALRRPPNHRNAEGISMDFFAELDAVRERWNVLEHSVLHPLVGRRAHARRAGPVLRPVPPRRDGARRRRPPTPPPSRTTPPAARARGPRRRGGLARRAVGPLHRRRRRRRRRRADARDGGLRRRLGRRRRAPAADLARRDVRDRVGAAGDRGDQARGPRRPLRLRRRAATRPCTSTCTRRSTSSTRRRSAR